MNDQLREKFLKKTHIEPDWFLYQVLELLDPDPDNLTQSTFSKTFCVDENGNLTACMEFTKNQIVIRKYEQYETNTPR